MIFELTASAIRDLSKLPKNIRRRILDKMEWFAAREDPLSFAKPLKNSKHGQYRFRVGEYRIFADVHRNTLSILFILAVKHRKEAYKL